MCACVSVCERERERKEGDSEHVNEHPSIEGGLWPPDR